MKNIASYCLIFAIAICFSSPSLADNKMRTAEITKNFNSTEPYSSVDLMFFVFFNVYDVYIWTDAEKWSFNDKFALQIDYNISASSKSIAEKSVEEISRYYDISDSKKELEEIFKSIFPDIKDGDITTGVYTPKEGAVFYHNESYSGKIEDDMKAKMFFDIWLHENNNFKKESCKLRKVNNC